MEHGHDPWPMTLNSCLSSWKCPFGHLAECTCVALSVPVLGGGGKSLPYPQVRLVLQVEVFLGDRG